MTRILDRYLLRELLGPFFLGLVTITLVLFIQKMFRLTELVISKGVTFDASLKLFLLILPGFLVTAIPMSTLLASLVAFSRLSADSEITALRASCVSLYRMLRPVALLAALSCVLTGLISLVVLPRANLLLKEHMFSMVKSSAMVAIEPGVFSAKFNGLVIFVDRMPDPDHLEGIFISDERSLKDPYAITAKRGRLIADPDSMDVVLAMEDGAIHRSLHEREPFVQTSFKAGNLYMDINNFFIPTGQFSTGYKHVDTDRLLGEIAEAKRTGQPTASMESELHTRLSLPFACLIFGIIGAPMGIRRSRSGKSASVATALAVFLGYYIVLGSSKGMTEAGSFPAHFAYWVPNALIAVGCAAAIYKKGQEIHLGIIDGLSRFFFGILRRRSAASS